MFKKAFPILLALSILLTACMGQPAEPTMSPADIEGTAVSAAMTMVAQTQAAIPTPTPVPPTETPSPTPLPTFTPEPIFIPTMELILPTATKSSSDSCLKPLNMGEAGPTTPMRIENQSGGTIEWLSLNLSTNAFGQCGALSYNNIKPNEKRTIALPRGSWWAWAGIKYKNGSSSNASGSFILRPADNDLLRIIVGSETISAKP